MGSPAFSGNAGRLIVLLYTPVRGARRRALSSAWRLLFFRSSPELPPGPGLPAPSPPGRQRGSCARVLSPDRKKRGKSNQQKNKRADKDEQQRLRKLKRLRKRPTRRTFAPRQSKREGDEFSATATETATPLSPPREGKQELAERAPNHGHAPVSAPPRPSSS